MIQHIQPRNPYSRGNESSYSNEKKTILTRPIATGIFFTSPIGAILGVVGYKKFPWRAASLASGCVALLETAVSIDLIQACNKVWGQNKSTLSHRNGGAP